MLKPFAKLFLTVHGQNGNFPVQEYPEMASLARFKGCTLLGQPSFEFCAVHEETLTDLLCLFNPIVTSGEDRGLARERNFPPRIDFSPSILVFVF